MAWAKRSGQRRWIACWRDAHGAVASKGGFRRKPDAVDFGEEQEAAIRRGDYIDPTKARATLAELWNAWLVDAERAQAEHGAAARPSVTTIRKWSSTWTAHVHRRLGDVPIGKITRGELKSMRDEIRSPHQANEALKLVRLLLQRAVDAEWISVNRADRIKHRSLPPRTEPRILEPKEIRRIATELGDDWRAFSFVTCYGGLRLSEALALELDDVDWLRRRIHVCKALVTDLKGRPTIKATKTSASDRWVELPTFVVEELSEHVRRRDAKAGLLFPAPEGGPQRLKNFRDRVWYPALERAELGRIQPRHTRHTGASLVLEAGGSLKDVADRLGHTSVRMADEIYAKLFDRRRREIADRLGDLDGADGTASAR